MRSPGGAKETRLAILSPLRGSCPSTPRPTHGSRRGLLSGAAPQLTTPTPLPGKLRLAYQPASPLETACDVVKFYEAGASRSRTVRNLPGFSRLGVQTNTARRPRRKKLRGGAVEDKWGRRTGGRQDSEEVGRGQRHRGTDEPRALGAQAGSRLDAVSHALLAVED